MSTTHGTYDEVRDLFEGTFTDMEVKAVLDYSDEYLVVIVKMDDGDDTIRDGGVYKIDRKTGETSMFIPTEDIHRFNDALQNRSKFY